MTSWIPLIYITLIYTIIMLAMQVISQISKVTRSYCTIELAEMHAQRGVWWYASGAPADGTRTRVCVKPYYEDGSFALSLKCLDSRIHRT
jgi:hypothetical protein